MDAEKLQLLPRRLHLLLCDIKSELAQQCQQLVEAPLALVLRVSDDADVVGVTGELDATAACHGHDLGQEHARVVARHGQSEGNDVESGRAPRHVDNAQVLAALLGDRVVPKAALEVDQGQPAVLGHERGQVRQ